MFAVIIHFGTIWHFVFFQHLRNSKYSIFSLLSLHKQKSGLILNEILNILENNGFFAFYGEPNVLSLCHEFLL